LETEDLNTALLNKTTHTITAYSVTVAVLGFTFRGGAVGWP